MTETFDRTQLTRMTDAVNAAIAEEYHLFGVDDPPELTPGAMRATMRVVTAWLPAQKPATPSPPAPAQPQNDGGSPSDVEATRRRYNSLTGQLVTVNPEDAQASDSPPDTGEAAPAEASDVDTSGTLGGHLGKLQDAGDQSIYTFFDQVIGQLHRISPDGKSMPTQRHWDQNKPPDLPTSYSVRKRLAMSWNEIASQANLQPNAGRPAREHSENGAGESTDDEDDTPAPAEASGPRPPTLEEVDQRNRELVAQVASAMAKIAQDLDLAGEMPLPETWNDMRPAHLPTAEELITQLAMEWPQIAHRCGMVPRPEGSRGDDKIPAMDADTKRAMLEDIIFELRIMAEPKTKLIPDAQQWNARRRSGLPSAEDIVLLWKLDSWYDMADMARLEKPEHEKKRLGRSVTRADKQAGASRPRYELAKEGEEG